MRFVIVGTMLRGRLDAPEPLDENGQLLAAARMEQDNGSSRHAQVLWNRDHGPLRDAGAPRRERMSVTAGDVAWARRILASVAGG